jgi:hypothetical protein
MLAVGFEVLVPPLGKKGMKFARGGANGVNVAIGDRRLDLRRVVRRRSRFRLLAELNVHGVISNFVWA